VTRRFAALPIGAALTILLAPGSAQAQGFGGPGGPFGPGPGSGPSNGPAQAGEASPESVDNLPVESNRSLKLFDQKRTVQGFDIQLGPVWYREAGRTPNDFERGTGELLIGVSITTKWAPFFLTGYQQMHLRAFDSKSFALSILTTHMGAGLTLGPIEPEVRIGAGLVTVDVFHGDYSIEALSPRVAAGVGLHLGKIRLDIATHSEYLWRWFGKDYLIRGVSLGLRLDVIRPKGPSFSDQPR
jgi:hypothetical protein